MIREERSDVVLVWTTLPDDGDGAAFARTLVTERLAACVTTQSGSRSVYRWQNEIEEGSECQLVIKTTADRVAALQQRVEELHPYEVPEFLVLPVNDGSATYLDWVRRETRAEAGSG